MLTLILNFLQAYLSKITTSIINASGYPPPFSLDFEYFIYNFLLMIIQEKNCKIYFSQLKIPYSKENFHLEIIKPETYFSGLGFFFSL